MSERPEWFAPKRFGYGAGFPIRWQGWAIMAVTIAVTIGSAMLFADRPLLLASILGPVVILMLLVTARTTRGGWRWRWGKRD